MIAAADASAVAFALVLLDRAEQHGVSALELITTAASRAATDPRSDTFFRGLALLEQCGFPTPLSSTGHTA